MAENKWVNPAFAPLGEASRDSLGRNLSGWKQQVKDQAKDMLNTWRGSLTVRYAHVERLFVMTAVVCGE